MKVKYSLNPSILKCLSGEGTKKDAKDAFLFLHKRAKSGLAQTQFEYGHALFTGFDNYTFKDRKKAVDWLQLAAQQSHVQATFYLAQAYHRGEGIEQDFVMAVHLYSELVKLEDPEVECRLGECIANGSGYGSWSGDLFPMNEAETEAEQKYFKEIMLIKGVEGTPDYWIEKAAYANHIEAQYLLGGGCEWLAKSWSQRIPAYQGLMWMEMAAANGHLKAQVLVGDTYLTGEGRLAGPGFVIDTSKGFKFLKAAAEQGHFEAQYFVADAYAIGISVSADAEQAMKWFALAVNNECSIHLKDQLHPEYEDWEGSFLYYDYLKRDQGGVWFPGAHANFRLGRALFRGIGIEKDIDAAKACIEIAVEYEVKGARELQSLIIKGLEEQEENDNFSIFERSTLDIIAAGENEGIEYKETFSLNTRTGQNNDKKIKYATVREVAGFLNSQDGVLLIGVSDAQIVTGVECDGFKGNGDKYTLKINDVIMSAIGDAATASCVKVKFDVIEDKTVCRIECQKSKKPVYCSYQGEEKLFIRIGSSTKEPKPSEWDKWKDTNFD